MIMNAVCTKKPSDPVSQMKKGQYIIINIINKEVPNMLFYMLLDVHSRFCILSTIYIVIIGISKTLVTTTNLFIKQRRKEIEENIS